MLPSCSDEQDPNDPQPDARNFCWSGGGTPTPGASVELGTGPSEFEPLDNEQDLPLFPGTQGGAHFFLQAKIAGLSPGERSGAREVNPSTWFSIHLENGEDITGLDCEYPRAYVESDGGKYELPYGRAVQIDPAYLETIYGQRVRVMVEVMDAQGRYATDERWVIAVEPSAPIDAGIPDAIIGAEDAGILDAGIPDGDAAPADASPPDGA